MDKHSEVESKFRAEKVTPQHLFQYAAEQAYRLDIQTYKDVHGWDTYYRHGLDGQEFIRHRFDGRRETSVLTCKERKSEESISDRHEVDLYIREDMKPPDARAFLKMAGFRPFFTIEKRSYILHLHSRIGGSACVALYDVIGDGKWHPDARFLEVEIEKDNKFTQEEANKALTYWIEEMQAAFSVGKPLNSSLFELYAPKCEKKPTCMKHSYHDGVCKLAA